MAEEERQEEQPIDPFSDPADEGLPDHQFHVAGTLVTLRTSYPLRANRELIGLMRQMNPDDLSGVVPVATRMIESWGFEGDPADPASYEDLDVFSVLWPLQRKLNRFWVGRTLNLPKVRAGGSTTP